MSIRASTPVAAALDEYVDARATATAAARRSLGVSELEARALRVIASEPGIRPSVLRDHLGVTSAGVTTLVDRLVGRDLVRRELDEDDRRVNHIHLTIDLLVEPWSALDRFSRALDDAAGEEPADAQQAFADTLRRITAAARARG